MCWYYARFILEGVSSKAAISGLEVVLMDDKKKSTMAWEGKMKSNVSGYIGERCTLRRCNECGSERCAFGVEGG